MKTIILLTFLLGSTLLIKSQSTISGKVIDANGEAVAFANAVLYLAADSQMMKAEITDMDGIFKMSGISQGDYHLKISFVGYTTYESETFSLSDNSTKSFDNIQLITDENVLDAVEITTERALIEVQPDKTIFNVEGSVNATGNTALELLRKAPGVMVDNNDNIILLGKKWNTNLYRWKTFAIGR